MSVKQKLDNNTILDLLDDVSRKIILEEFIAKHYTSGAVYLNAILNMLYTLEKQDVTTLTINDYQKIIPDKDHQTPQDKYCASFFRFLYAYDYLKNTEGFESIMLKTNSISHFEALKMKKASEENTEPKEETENALSIEDILMIQNVLNKETENIEMIKIGLVWHMLFETEIPVTTLKKLKSNQFMDGYITTSKKNYKIPEKYQIISSYLNKRSPNSGFSSINDWMKKLGEIAGVGYLYPQKIINTKNQNMVPCSNCLEKYSNIVDNWMSVNNRIICTNCFEKLKKKDSIIAETVPGENINIFNDSSKEIEISSIVYTFDELRKDIPATVDFKKLREYQEKIGKMGEAYVYDVECVELLGSRYEGKVDNTKALDPSNGYDILSFNKLDGSELHIEVKTTADDDSDFYLSKNELDTAKRMKSQGEIYLIYRVTNILAENKDDIKVEIIKDISDNNDFEFIETNYRVRKMNFADSGI